MSWVSKSFSKAIAPFTINDFALLLLYPTICGGEVTNFEYREVYASLIRVRRFQSYKTLMHSRVLAINKSTKVNGMSYVFKVLFARVLKILGKVNLSSDRSLYNSLRNCDNLIHDLTVFCTNMLDSVFAIIPGSFPRLKDIQFASVQQFTEWFRVELDDYLSQLNAMYDSLIEDINISVDRSMLCDSFDCEKIVGVIIALFQRRVEIIVSIDLQRFLKELVSCSRLITISFVSVDIFQELTLYYTILHQTLINHIKNFVSLLCISPSFKFVVTLQKFNLKVSAFFNGCISSNKEHLTKMQVFLNQLPKAGEIPKNDDFESIVTRLLVNCDVLYESYYEMTTKIRQYYLEGFLNNVLIEITDTEESLVDLCSSAIILKAPETVRNSIYRFSIVFSEFLSYFDSILSIEFLELVSEETSFTFFKTNVIPFLEKYKLYDDYMAVIVKMCQDPIQKAIIFGSETINVTQSTVFQLLNACNGEDDMHSVFIKKYGTLYSISALFSAFKTMYDVLEQRYSDVFKLYNRFSQYYERQYSSFLKVQKRNLDKIVDDIEFLAKLSPLFKSYKSIHPFVVYSALMSKFSDSHVGRVVLGCLGDIKKKYELAMETCSDIQHFSHLCREFYSFSLSHPAVNELENFQLREHYVLFSDINRVFMQILSLFESPYTELSLKSVPSFDFDSCAIFNNINNLLVLLREALIAVLPYITTLQDSCLSTRQSSMFELMVGEVVHGRNFISFICSPEKESSFYKAVRMLEFENSLQIQVKKIINIVADSHIDVFMTNGFQFLCLDCIKMLQTQLLNSRNDSYEIFEHLSMSHIYTETTLSMMNEFTIFLNGLDDVLSDIGFFINVTEHLCALFQFSYIFHDTVHEVQNALEIWFSIIKKNSFLFKEKVNTLPKNGSQFSSINVDECVLIGKIRAQEFFGKYRDGKIQCTPVLPKMTIKTWCSKLNKLCDTLANKHFSSSSWPVIFNTEQFHQACDLLYTIKASGSLSHHMVTMHLPHIHSIRWEKDSIVGVWNTQDEYLEFCSPYKPVIDSGFISDAGFVAPQFISDIHDCISLALTTNVIEMSTNLSDLDMKAFIHLPRFCGFLVIVRLITVELLDLEESIRNGNIEQYIVKAQKLKESVNFLTTIGNNYSAIEGEWAKNIIVTVYNLYARIDEILNVRRHSDFLMILESFVLVHLTSDDVCLSHSTPEMLPYTIDNCIIYISFGLSTFFRAGMELIHPYAISKNKLLLPEPNYHLLMRDLVVLCDDSRFFVVISNNYHETRRMFSVLSCYSLRDMSYFHYNEETSVANLTTLLERTFSSKSLLVIFLQSPLIPIAVERINSMESKNYFTKGAVIIVTSQRYYDVSFFGDSIIPFTYCKNESSCLSPSMIFCALLIKDHQVYGTLLHQYVSEFSRLFGLYNTSSLTNSIAMSISFMFTEHEFSEKLFASFLFNLFFSCLEWPFEGFKHVEQYKNLSSKDSFTLMHESFFPNIDHYSIEDLVPFLPLFPPLEIIRSHMDRSRCDDECGLYGLLFAITCCFPVHISIQTLISHDIRYTVVEGILNEFLPRLGIEFKMTMLDCCSSEFFNDYYTAINNTPLSECIIAKTGFKFTVFTSFDRYEMLSLQSINPLFYETSDIKAIPLPPVFCISEEQVLDDYIHRFKDEVSKFGSDQLVERAVEYLKEFYCDAMDLYSRTIWKHSEFKNHRFVAFHFAVTVYLGLLHSRLEGSTRNDLEIDFKFAKNAVNYAYLSPFIVFEQVDFSIDQIESTPFNTAALGSYISVKSGELQSFETISQEQMIRKLSSTTFEQIFLLNSNMLTFQYIVLSHLIGSQILNIPSTIVLDGSFSFTKNIVVSTLFDVDNIWDSKQISYPKAHFGGLLEDCTNVLLDVSGSEEKFLCVRKHLLICWNSNPSELYTIYSNRFFNLEEHNILKNFAESMTIMTSILLERSPDLHDVMYLFRKQIYYCFASALHLFYNHALECYDVSMLYECLSTFKLIEAMISGGTKLDYRALRAFSTHLRLKFCDSNDQCHLMITKLLDIMPLSKQELNDPLIIFNNKYLSTEQLFTLFNNNVHDIHSRAWYHCNEDILKIMINIQDTSSCVGFVLNTLSKTTSLSTELFVYLLRLSLEKGSLVSQKFNASISYDTSPKVPTAIIIDCSTINVCMFNSKIRQMIISSIHHAHPLYTFYLLFATEVQANIISEHVQGMIVSRMTNNWDKSRYFPLPSKELISIDRRNCILNDDMLKSIKYLSSDLSIYIDIFISCSKKIISSNSTFKFNEIDCVTFPSVDVLHSMNISTCLNVSNYFGLFSSFCEIIKSAQDRFTTLKNLLQSLNVDISIQKSRLVDLKKQLHKHKLILAKHLGTGISVSELVDHKQAQDFFRKQVELEQRIVYLKDNVRSLKTSIDEQQTIINQLIKVFPVVTLSDEIMKHVQVCSLLLTFYQLAISSVTVPLVKSIITEFLISSGMDPSIIAKVIEVTLTILFPISFSNDPIPFSQQLLLARIMRLYYAMASEFVMISNVVTPVKMEKTSVQSIFAPVIIVDIFKMIIHPWQWKEIFNFAQNKFFFVHMTSLEDFEFFEPLIEAVLKAKRTRETEHVHFQGAFIPIEPNIRISVFNSCANYRSSISIIYNDLLLIGESFLNTKKDVSRQIDRVFGKNKEKIPLDFVRFMNIIDTNLNDHKNDIYEELALVDFFNIDCSVKTHPEIFSLRFVHHLFNFNDAFSVFVDNYFVFVYPVHHFLTLYRNLMQQEDPKTALFDLLSVELLRIPVHFRLTAMYYLFVLHNVFIDSKCITDISMLLSNDSFDVDSPLMLKNKISAVDLSHELLNECLKTKIAVAKNDDLSQCTKHLNNFELVKSETRAVAELIITIDTALDITYSNKLCKLVLWCIVLSPFTSPNYVSEPCTTIFASIFNHCSIEIFNVKALFAYEPLDIFITSCNLILPVSFALADNFIYMSLMINDDYNLINLCEFMQLTASEQQSIISKHDCLFVKLEFHDTYIDIQHITAIVESMDASLSPRVVFLLTENVYKQLRHNIPTILYYDIRNFHNSTIQLLLQVFNHYDSMFYSIDNCNVTLRQTLILSLFTTVIRKARVIDLLLLYNHLAMFLSLNSTKLKTLKLKTLLRSCGASENEVKEFVSVYYNDEVTVCYASLNIPIFYTRSDIISYIQTKFPLFLYRDSNGVFGVSNDQFYSSFSSFRLITREFVAQRPLSAPLVSVLDHKKRRKKENFLNNI
ncbi:hypothetical protein PCE1_001921 [Barthelona sp. PCE]